MAARSYKRIGAVTKSIEIMGFLSEQRGPVPAREISAAVSLPYDTAMCHLVTLEDEQLVKCVNGKYELGPRFAVYWSRYRARLETQMTRLQQEYQDLEVRNEQA